jgi:hypothetical protein
VDILAYIHSNKFITTKLFHQKFHPKHSLWTACIHLNRLVEKGLVLRFRNLPNEDSFYCLTRPSLRHLSGLARILISPEVRSPRINLFEREHDKRVLATRIQIEEAGGLEGLTWLSDYEMHIPTQSAHPIRLNPPTKSDPKRPPNPTESAHPVVAFLKG